MTTVVSICLKLLQNEGMKIFIICLLALAYGCSQVKPKLEERNDDVSINAALNQAQASYLLGCVEALKKTQTKPAFPECRELAIKHRVQIEEIIRQIPLPGDAPQ